MTMAQRLHQSGRLQEAEQVYRQVIASDPNHAGAWHFLGVIAFQVGIGHAAVDAIQRALALKPDYIEAHQNLAAVFDGQGKFDDAVGCYRLALALRPNNPTAQFGLGLVLRKQGKLEEAAGCFREAVALSPEFAEALNELGNLLIGQGKPDEAIACYQRAATVRPDYLEAYNNLGGALQARGRMDEAVTAYRKAVALNPAIAEVLNGLATALQVRGDSDEAIACYHRALALKPLNVEAHNNLGNALKDQARLSEAFASYRKALEIRPDYLDAYRNLLFSLYFSPDFDAVAIYEEHRRWNHQHAEPLTKFHRPHANNGSPERRLRVGYVSPDFRDNVLALFLVPLFNSHDHKDFEIFCYSDVTAPDGVTERVRSKADVWRNIVGISDEQAADLIRRDEIDILVDLAMHAANGRPLLFARKPAPLQICWLAYPGTTGLSTMDYRLTDPYLDPPGLDDRYYSEQSLRLPDSFWCYDSLSNEPTVNELPALQVGHVTFGCLNNPCKVNAGVLKLWARALKAVGRSVLVLLAPEGAYRQRTLDLMGREGVAADRIAFVHRRPRNEYLKLYHQIDICLDTIPYNGHTTSLDAFWMGVPVITIVGKTAAGRAGMGQLTNLGLQEFIAETSSQFVQIAVAQSGDLGRLSKLRASLRARLQASPLMDAARFSRNIERAYRDVWQSWCEVNGDTK